MRLCVAMLAFATACGGGAAQTHNAPGATADVNSLAIRYAHIAEPDDGVWAKGSDVAAYLWVLNQGERSDRLVAASSPAADSTAIVDQQGKSLPGGVELPPHEARQMYRDGPHLLLRGIHEELRAGDYVKLTVRFSKSGSASMQVHVQRSGYETVGPSETG